MSLLPDLERLVVDAAERHPVAGTRRQRKRSWASRHLAVIAIGAIATVGTATAAVVSLRGEPSAPTEGRLALNGAEAGLADYRVKVTPMLEPGLTGWCTTTMVSAPKPTDSIGGGTCRRAPIANRHTIAAGLIGGQPILMSLVVDRRVAAARLQSGRVILAGDAPDLPDGYRAIVTTIERSEYEQIHGGRPPSWELLDSSGAVITDGNEEDESSRAQAQPAIDVGGDQDRGSCGLRLPAADALGSSKVRALANVPRPVEGLHGDAFLPCLTSLVGHAPGAEMRMDLITAAVLLNAGAPSSSAPDLPGQRPTSAPGIFTANASTLPSIGNGDQRSKRPTATAKRFGKAWLFIQGGTEAERLRLIETAEVRLP